MADFCRPEPDPAKEATSYRMARWKGHGDAMIERDCIVCGLKMMVPKNHTGTKYCDEHKPGVK